MHRRGRESEKVMVSWSSEDCVGFGAGGRYFACV